MTNEETKVVLKSLADNPLLSAEHITKALYKAIELLEQQPCEDCISREAVLKYIDKMPSGLTSDGRRMVRRRTLEEYISDTLPSVTPARPKGKWVLIHPLQENDDGAYICSNCEHGDWDCDINYKYCPFCGADMRGDEDADDN